MSKPVFPNLNRFLSKVETQAQRLEREALAVTRARVAQAGLSQPVIPAVNTAPFIPFEVDHRTASLLTGIKIPITGKRLYLTRGVTTPNTQFSVILSDRIYRMFPGSHICAPFDGLTIVRDNAISSDQSGGSPYLPTLNEGIARFIVSTDERYVFEEPEIVLGAEQRPYQLVGTWLRTPSTTNPGILTGSNFPAFKGADSQWFFVGRVSKILVTVWPGSGTPATATTLSLQYQPISASNPLDNENSVVPAFTASPTVLNDFDWTPTLSAIQAKSRIFDVSSLYGWCCFYQSAVTPGGGILNYIVQGIA